MNGYPGRVWIGELLAAAESYALKKRSWRNLCLGAVSNVINALYGVVSGHGER